MGEEGGGEGDYILPAQAKDMLVQLLTSLIPRLSLCTNHTASNRKLGGAWERGYLLIIFGNNISLYYKTRLKKH